MTVDKLDVITLLVVLIIFFISLIFYLYPRVHFAAVPRVTEPLASETRSAAVLYDLAWGKP